MLGFLIVFQDATLSDLNHPMLRRFATLHTSWSSCCLAFFIVMLLFSDRLIWSSRCYAVWSSLPHASLLDLNSFMLFGFGLNTSCMLLGLGFMTLGCWILSASCYVAWCSLPPVMLFDLLPICLIWPSWCHAAWWFLPHATVLNLPSKMLCCWMVPISCYDNRSCHQGATLVDLI